MAIKTKVKHVFRRRRVREFPHEPGKGDLGGGPDGGVREPRTPKGSQPADAVAQPEPR